jgi:hypothetical protein
MEDFIFLLNFVEKLAPNRPKADKGENYILNLILLKNEPFKEWVSQI